MKTTALFAELVVIGVGTLSAIVLTFIAFIPISSQTVTTVSPLFLIPLLAVLYLVGILADRIADYFSEDFLEKIWPGKISVNPEWKEKRGRLLVENEFFKEMWLYSKSRSRIVRGWILNSILLILNGVRSTL